MPNKIYIGNLPYTVSVQELEQLFSNCGTVVNVHIPADKDTGRPRGFAFVELSSQEEVENAISDYDNSIIGGRNIKVTEALEKTGKDTSHEPSRKSYAKELGTGECILCGTVDTIYGVETGGSYSSGVCSFCISSLSKAVRPPRFERASNRR
jgi:cold-inducible RNA-binding protein